MEHIVVGMGKSNRIVSWRGNGNGKQLSSHIPSNRQRRLINRGRSRWNTCVCATFGRVGGDNNASGKPCEFTGPGDWNQCDRDSSAGEHGEHDGMVGPRAVLDEIGHVYSDRKRDDCRCDSKPNAVFCCASKVDWRRSDNVGRETGWFVGRN